MTRSGRKKKEKERGQLGAVGVEESLLATGDESVSERIGGSRRGRVIIPRLYALFRQQRERKVSVDDVNFVSLRGKSRTP